MIETSFTRLVGVAAPIQLAAMPGVTTPELVAAVANAGGLGMLGAPLLSAPALEAALQWLAAETRGGFGVNFLIPFLDPACLSIAARRARVVEFFYGEPDAELVARAREFGACVSWQVGSVAEAEAAERAGCDFVVAQGTEAGGHVRGETSLLPLLSLVHGHPLRRGDGIRRASKLRAGVARRVRGRHLSHAGVRRRLAGGAASRAALGGSKGRSAHAGRGRRAGARRADDPGAPLLRPGSDSRGQIDAMALYAGESVAHVSSVQPAAAIISDLVSGAERLLRAAAD